MEYEYSFLHIVSNIDPVIADSSPKDFLQATAAGLDECLTFLHRQLPQHKGGGWEAVSHDVSRIGPFLLVTFLIRRPQGSTTPS